MLKVMHFIHGFSMGGAETLVKEYCLRLDKNEIDLVVLCITRCNSPYDAILKDAGIRVIYIEDEIKDVKFLLGINRFYKIAKRFLLARKYIRKERPDVLHTHLSLNSYVKFAKPFKPIRIYHTVHNVPEELWTTTHKDQLDYRAVEWLTKNYDMKFIALNEEMKEQINEIFNVKDTIVLNNGIDFNRFDIEKVNKHLREDYGIAENTYVLGHVGRFSDQKNHKFLIDVFQKLVEIRPDSLLILVGNGEMKSEIKKEIEKKNIADKVLFMENRTDIPDIMNMMDVFVFPSKFEGLGIVLIEAQKMQVRCVVSDKIPSAAIVSNLVRVKGLSEPAEDWVDTILNFPIEEVEYRKIEEWDMDRVVQKLQELYLCS